MKNISLTLLALKCGIKISRYSNKAVTYPNIAVNQCLLVMDSWKRNIYDVKKNCHKK